jgi:hypothetical protein
MDNANTHPSLYPNIQLHIERLILDGIEVPQAQRPLLQAAVEAELGRLLTENGLGSQWRSGGSVPSLSAPSLTAPTLQLPAGGNPTQWGQQIAQSVYGGIHS